MEPCSQWREWIELEHDGELDEPQKKMLNTHLEGCPECLRYSRMLKAISGILADDPVRPPMNFTDNVMAAVKKEASAGKKKEKNRIWSLVPAVAAAAILLAVGVTVMRSGNLRSAADTSASTEVMAMTSVSMEDAVSGSDALKGTADKSEILSAAESTASHTDANVFETVQNMSAAAKSDVLKKASRPGSTKSSASVNTVENTISVN